MTEVTQENFTRELDKLEDAVKRQQEFLQTLVAEHLIATRDLGVTKTERVNGWEALQTKLAEVKGERDAAREAARINAHEGTGHLKRALATEAREAELRKVLEWIIEKCHGPRETVSDNNVWLQFNNLNRDLIEIRTQARTALSTTGEEGK